MGRFTEVRAQYDALIARPGIEADSPVRAYGGFSFEPGDPRGRWSAFPAAYFFIPQIEIVQAGETTTWTVNQLQKDGFNAESLIQRLTTIGKSMGSSRRSTRMLVEPDEWSTMVANALKQVNGGKMSKVVLARILEVEATDPIDAGTALRRLRNAYASTYGIGFSPQAGRALISASPEQLVRVADGELHSMALAGTMPRGGTVDEDQDIASAFISNPKERKEHAIVREEIEATLQPFCTSVTTHEHPNLRRLPNVQHLHTLIRGKLKQNQHILDIVAALHPTPALGGRPRQAALDLIRELETQPRGWYGAPVGYFDQHGDGEFAVAIRSALIDGKYAWLYAGAGIVAGSDAEREWDETQAKLEPMLEAFQVSA
jgi:menaquinone-specific isochorismate synthase